MTTSITPEKAVNGIRTAIGVAGLLSVIVGVLILVWPGRTAMVVTATIAVYALIAGLVYAGLGIFAKTKGGWARVGLIILGLVFIVAAVLAFLNLAATTLWLAVFLGILVGIVWIVEGVVAFTTLGDASSKAWSVIFAVLSIAAGIVLLFAPLWGVEVLWLILGISLVVLGLVNVVRAFRYGKKA